MVERKTILAIVLSVLLGNKDNIDHCIVCPSQKQRQYWPLYCLSFLETKTILAIVLSVHLQILTTPLVSSNFVYTHTTLIHDGSPTWLGTGTFIKREMMQQFPHVSNLPTLSYHWVISVVVEIVEFIYLVVMTHKMLYVLFYKIHNGLSFHARQYRRPSEYIIEKQWSKLNQNIIANNISRRLYATDRILFNRVLKYSENKTLLTDKMR